LCGACHGRFKRGRLNATGGSAPHDGHSTPPIEALESTQKKKKTGLLQQGHRRKDFLRSLRALIRIGALTAGASKYARTVRLAEADNVGAHLKCHQTHGV
jgi:hypothetical protein